MAKGPNALSFIQTKKGNFLFSDPELGGDERVLPTTITMQQWQKNYGIEVSRGIKTTWGAVCPLQDKPLY